MSISKLLNTGEETREKQQEENVEIPTKKEVAEIIRNLRNNRTRREAQITAEMPTGESKTIHAFVAINRK